MKSFIKEFKDFAIKGNMIDMAVGIIIGTAFNNVVNILVKKIVMPPLSLLTDNVNNISERKYVLREAAGEVSEVAIGYGELIEVLIDFLVIALTIFMVIKGINRFKKKAEDPRNKTVETPKNIELLSNIEGLMKEQNELLKSKK